MSTGLGLNMYITVFLGCLVGIVVVAQTLYTSTMEHIKEFGTVKAIGGQQLGHLRDPRQAGARSPRWWASSSARAMAFAHAAAHGELDLKLIITPSLAVTVFVGTVALSSPRPWSRSARSRRSIRRWSSGPDEREHERGDDARPRGTRRHQGLPARAARRVTVLRGVVSRGRARRDRRARRALAARARRRSSRSSAASSRPTRGSVVDRRRARSTRRGPAQLPRRSAGARSASCSSSSTSSRR